MAMEVNVHGAFVPPLGGQVLREDSKFNLKTGCFALAFVDSVFIIYHLSLLLVVLLVRLCFVHCIS